MSWEAWVTVAALALMFWGLARNYSPDLVMLATLTGLVTIGALSGTKKLPSVQQAFSAFGNEALLTVGALFVVAAGVSRTGAVNFISDRIFGHPRSVKGAQARLMLPVATLSAFLNNTPIVAMFLPVVSEWCKKHALSPSQFFIPLSFATVLGGVCTLIGTSTNLTVNGLWMQAGHPSLGMFDLAPLGIPVAIVGLLYMLFATRALLPDRREARGPQFDDPRKYTVEMIVESGGPLANRSIEEAGLRHLPGMFLAEIERDGQFMPAVGPEERLRGGDRLVFVGIVDSVVDLQKIRGLVPATDQVFKLNEPRSRRTLVEAVVSNTCPLVGMTVREGRFRTRYNAAVIAVARNGERINKKIGDIELRVGDTLLLEARPSFAEEQRNSRDFFLVSSVAGSTPLRYEQARIALGILLALIVMAGFEWISMLHAAVIAAGAMILANCLTGGEARRSIDLQVLLVIGASLGIGQALAVSGAAGTIAHYLAQFAVGNPHLSLAVIYLIGLLATEVLSNNAAVAIVFPIAIATAADLHANPMPFVFSLMVAGSCGFATPIGYQTHMMVYGPGGYRFFDFVRIGVPLDLLCGVVTVVLAPRIWPF